MPWYSWFILGVVITNIGWFFIFALFYSSGDKK